MELLIGLIFELFKIVIQSAIYGIIIVFVYKILFNKTFTLKTWILTSSIIAIAMLVLLNTHWGSHGFGDSRRIPLQFNKEIDIINGSLAYIDIKKNGTIPIADFTILENKVIGKTGIDATQTYPPYFVWDLKNDNLTYYNSNNELFSSENLKKINLEPFYKHYHKYWGGWRFWLLP